LEVALYRGDDVLEIKEEELGSGWCVDVSSLVPRFQHVSISVFQPLPV
jgi:hypothetical protein